MNKSKRIYVDVDNPNEKNIKINLNQDTNFLEILSLKISQKEAYQFFNADYGVLVGRVIANGGVGIPNAKISIFLPITDEDKENAEIFAAYPYETPRDKNKDSKRYNLLPRVAQEDIETGSFKPKQPFGSFPTKDEIITNDTWLEVYEKYYKYSTITNEAGDYMLFGVPTGTQVVHMSVDITDIGKYSMTPADMVVQLGYSDAFFNSDLTIKNKQDLEDLPHIETQEISVDIIPYWGDSTNFEIGINRQDFRIRAELINNFTLFGSYFTMGKLSVNGDPDTTVNGERGYDGSFYKLSDEYFNNVDFRTNRVGDINIKLYSYAPDVNMSVVDNDIATSGTTIDPQTDILIVDPNSYYENKQNGMFVLSVPCNRKKIVTDQLGNEVIVANDSTVGMFTEFYGFVITEFEEMSIEKEYAEKWRKPNTPNNARLRFKIPQDSFSIRDEETNAEFPAPWANTVATQIQESNIWRKKYFTFKGGNYYSVSQFFPTKNSNNIAFTPDIAGYVNTLDTTSIDMIYQVGMFKVGGTVQTTQQDLDNINVISGGTSGATPDTTFLYDFPYNATDTDNNNDLYFGAQWLNFSMYFPQINWTFAYTTANGNRNQNIADVFWKDYYRGLNGTKGEWFSVGGSKSQELVAGEIGTSFMASAHGIRTNFIEVPKDDIITFSGIDRKGLRKNDDNLNSVTLSGEYSYLPATGTSSNFNYEEVGYDDTNTATPTVSNPFFFKGMYNTDCIQLLLDLNFI